MLFLFKKTIGPLLMPLPLTLFVMVAGLVLDWRAPHRKTGRLLIACGLAALVLVSSKPLADSLLAPLEEAYPTLCAVDPATLPVAPFIVVLGGGHVSDPRLPPNSQLNAATLARLVEGIRLHRSLPGSRLLLSGGTGGGRHDPVTNAEIMAAAAKALGVREQAMVLEARSRDTKDEALILREMIGTEPFVLVTSASHMPRSMALFKNLGMQPLAAPASPLVKTSGARENPFDLPDAQDLHKSERAVYEYLGILWARLRGQID